MCKQNAPVVVSAKIGNQLQKNFVSISIFKKYVKFLSQVNWVAKNGIGIHICLYMYDRHCLQKQRFDHIFNGYTNVNIRIIIINNGRVKLSLSFFLSLDRTITGTIWLMSWAYEFKSGEAVFIFYLVRKKYLKEFFLFFPLLMVFHKMYVEFMTVLNRTFLSK